jgi:hypothetical protein
MAEKFPEPYKGLHPYEESDKDNFFGRDAARKILVNKILTNKLTLLFAATGVGKSSLLQAAVIPQMKNPQGENLEVVYHNRWWGGSPFAGLKDKVRDNLQQSGKLSVEVPQSKLDNFSFKDFFRFCALFTRQPLIVILDQFEDFFQYQQNTEYFDKFIKQLAETITYREVPIALVISMREDFAQELNAFKPYLPTILFENFYRLERLTEPEAKTAIVAPVERIGFQYEDAFLKRLFKDLASRELQRDA